MGTAHNAVQGIGSFKQLMTDLIAGRNANSLALVAHQVQPFVADVLKAS